MKTNKDKLNKIIAWKNAKPVSDNEWAEDIKQESFDIKFDKQLVQIKSSLQSKLPRAEEKLRWITKYPDFKRKQWDEMISEAEQTGGFDFQGKTKDQYIEDEITSKTDYYNWKNEKIKQSIERIGKEQDLRKRKIVTRVPVGTTYYIDADNGNDGNTGLSTGAAWATLDQFTENARSAGDTAILRRGTTARYDNASDLIFTSDGAANNPIIIEADYGNVFSDDVALANTYTPIFGSKTFEASATESELVAGDWVILGSDTKKEFAYEIKSVSGTTITLYIPYKGDESGAGIAGVKMLAAPVWNIVTGIFQWNFDGDHYWKTQGIDIRGKDGIGNVEIDSTEGHDFIDCIFTGSGTQAIALACTDEVWSGLLLKCRFFHHKFAFNNFAGTGILAGTLRDCFGDGNFSGSGAFIRVNNGTNMTVIDTETLGYAADVYFSAHGGALKVTGQNWIMGSTSKFQSFVDTVTYHQEHFFEDFNGVIGDTRQNGYQAPSHNEFSLVSDTGTVRSGGSAVSIKAIPADAKLGDIQGWTFSRLKLFKIPIYASTTSRVYTVYFNLPAANFTVAPTATELWIEMEAWGHASNNYRKITKSTGVVAIDGTWVSLSITVAPAQAGVAYLSCYYAKAKEGGKDNIFYVDPLPEIT